MDRICEGICLPICDPLCGDTEPTEVVPEAYSLRFNGTSYGSFPAIVCGTDFTISLWFKHDSDGNRSMLARDISHTSTLVIDSYNFGYIRFFGYKADHSLCGPVLQTSNDGYNDGEWHYVEVTCVASEVTLTVDGTDSVTDTFTFDGTEEVNRVAARGESSRYTGQVFDVYVSAGSTERNYKIDQEGEDIQPDSLGSGDVLTLTDVDHGTDWIADQPET